MIRQLALLAALAPAPQVDQLTWMAGCWSIETAAGAIEEQWSRPAGGAMLGMSRILKNGRMVFHEFMRIEEKDGALVFTPRIGSGSAPVSFRAVTVDASGVSFENPAHDFPQRVVYRRREDGMRAMIDGVDKGKPRAEHFPYHRVACP